MVDIRLESDSFGRVATLVGSLVQLQGWYKTFCQDEYSLTRSLMVVVWMDSVRILSIWQSSTVDKRSPQGRRFESREGL